MVGLVGALASAFVMSESFAYSFLRSPCLVLDYCILVDFRGAAMIRMSSLASAFVMSGDVWIFLFAVTLSGPAFREMLGSWASAFRFWNSRGVNRCHRLSPGQSYM